MPRQQSPRKRNEDLPPLEWKQIKGMESGKVRAKVTRADGHYKTIYSTSFARFDRGKHSSFFRSEDLDDLIELAEQAIEIIEKDSGQKIEQAKSS